MNPLPRTLEWVGDGGGFLRLLDQTLLPGRVEFRDCRTLDDVWESIRTLRVRGAPAIGVAAAYGVIVGMQASSAADYDSRLRQVTDHLRTSRPTAVNLFWALDEMAKCRSIEELLTVARRIDSDDQAMCRSIGLHGAALVPDGGGVLTHCNAGALATAGSGTALSVLYAAAEQGRRFHVFADETRPLLQGARLTAWELQRSGIPCTLICDNMAGQVMLEGRVQMVVVGADRIAANGDAANKIGTYSVAVLAQAHGVPFYVAAPTSTFDLSLATGDQIPIEQRDPNEITHGFGLATAPDDVSVYNPAFDVTPARLITAIVTDRGIIRPVTSATIQSILVAPDSQK